MQEIRKLYPVSFYEYSAGFVDPIITVIQDDPDATGDSSYLEPTYTGVDEYIIVNMPSGAPMALSASHTAKAHIWNPSDTYTVDAFIEVLDAETNASIGSNGFSVPPLTNYVLATNFYTDNLPNPKTENVRIKVILSPAFTDTSYAYGTISAVALEATVEVDSTPPEAPSGLSPNNSQMFLNANIQFSAYLSDYDTASMFMTVQWSDTPDFITVFGEATSDVVPSGTYAYVTARIDNGTWYWRAKANDGFNDSVYSTVESFTVDNATPDVPTIIRPENNAVTDTGTIDFEATVSDLYGEYVGLQIQISLTGDFSSIYDTASSGLVPSSSSATVTMTVNNYGTFYWRARTFDESNTYSSWSEIRQFSRPSTDIPIVTLVSISKNKISDETEMNTSTVTFKFDVDVTEYRVMVMGASWDTGTLAHSVVANVTAGTEITADIDNTECYQEGDNRINMYGKSTSGKWTAYES